MANLIPIATYNLNLQPFKPVAAIEYDHPVTVRLTSAAVDPEAVDEDDKPSTLRMLKRSLPMFDDYDEDDDEDFDEDESDELDEDEEEESEEEEKPKAKKGKKVEKEDEEEEDEEMDSSDEENFDDDTEEFVVCTLSPKIQYQQTIDVTIQPDEEVYFIVTGSYPIHLIGNYVDHPDDEDSDEEDYDDEEYDSDELDLTPDEDELIDEQQDYDLDELEDESDVENKIEELVEEDEKKNGKKRALEDEEPKPKETKKSKQKAKKEVQFAENLEQGPTGSEAKKEAKKETPKKEAAKKKDTKKDTKAPEAPVKFPTKTLLGGVVTEDRKAGKGQTAKSGNKVGIRYIGKLKNGKVFDKNTGGKPFVFGLGKGECIKGFDLGVAGMAVGGERRVVIPAKMGYGSQALPGIPANSELTFDIKLVSLK